MKLSATQKRALGKLTTGKWRSAHELQEGLSTLRSLVNKGLAQNNDSQMGALFFPRTHIFFRLTETGRKERG